MRPDYDAVKFTYHGSSVPSTEADINTRLAKACTATDRLLVIWKSDLINIIKSGFFFQADMYSCRPLHMA